MAFNEYPYRNLTDLNLDYLLKKLKELAQQLSEILAWKPEFEAAYQQIMNFIHQIEGGNLPPGMVNAINNWMQQNALDLVGDLVKMVFFGLTDDGYFVAYIPDQWDEITFFTTGLDRIIPGYGYGHLCIEY